MEKQHETHSVSENEDINIKELDLSIRGQALLNGYGIETVSDISKIYIKHGHSMDNLRIGDWREIAIRLAKKLHEIKNGGNA